MGLSVSRPGNFWRHCGLVATVATLFVLETGTAKAQIFPDMVPGEIIVGMSESYGAANATPTAQRTQEPFMNHSLVRQGLERSVGVVTEEMPMYANILIATDGSELAGKAVEHGVAFAKAIGARIVVLTVVAPFRIFTVNA